MTLLAVSAVFAAVHVVATMAAAARVRQSGNRVGFLAVASEAIQAVMRAVERKLSLRAVIEYP